MIKMISQDIRHEPLISNPLILMLSLGDSNRAAHLLAKYSFDVDDDFVWNIGLIIS